MENKPEGGTVVFVLGLLGLLMCQVLGIVAWVMGNTYMSKCREMDVAPEGIAVAGRLLGIISTSIFAISLVIGIMMGSCVLLYKTDALNYQNQKGMEDLINSDLLNSDDEVNGR